MFLTGKAPYPVERTLLTSGLVEAGVRSLADGQKRLETPHLAIRYQAPRESTSGEVEPCRAGATAALKAIILGRGTQAGTPREPAF